MGVGPGMRMGVGPGMAQTQTQTHTHTHSQAWARAGACGRVRSRAQAPPTPSPQPAGPWALGSGSPVLCPGSWALGPGSRVCAAHLRRPASPLLLGQRGARHHVADDGHHQLAAVLAHVGHLRTAAAITQRLASRTASRSCSAHTLHTVFHVCAVTSWSHAGHVPTYAHAVQSWTRGRTLRARTS